MLTALDQDITLAQAQKWTVVVISQLWGLASIAWEERNHALHKDKNATIAQSEMDVKFQEYYHNQQTISTRDVHLFTQPLQDLIRARLGTKRRILEKAAFLFEDSARMAKSDQRCLNQFYNTIPQESRDHRPHLQVGQYTPSRYQANKAHNFLYPLKRG